MSLLDTCRWSHLLLCYQQFTIFSISLREEERKEGSAVYCLVISVVLWSLNWWRVKNCLLLQPWPHAELQKETQGWICKKPCDNSLLTIPRAAAFLPHYCFSGFIMLSSFFIFACFLFAFSQRAHYQFSHLASSYLGIWAHIFVIFFLPLFCP